MKTFREKCFQKGFTLVELLVVIAIIVVFASMLAVSTRVVSNRGKDARITANIDSLRKAAAIYWAATLTYSGFCSDADVVLLKEDTERLGG